jgi:hypothetical protein
MVVDVVDDEFVLSFPGGESDGSTVCSVGVGGEYGESGEGREIVIE